MTTADDPMEPGRRYLPPTEGTADARKRGIFDEEQPPTVPRMPAPDVGGDPYRWDRPIPQGPPVMPGAGRGRHGGSTGEQHRVDIEGRPYTVVPIGEPTPVRVKRSWLEILHDVVWTIVGLLIIALVVSFLMLGAKALRGVGSVSGDGAPDATITVPCTEPTHDDYGTYCADTPGGG
jgi:hypothetical protein